MMNYRLPYNVIYIHIHISDAMESVGFERWTSGVESEEVTSPLLIFHDIATFSLELDAKRF